MSQETETPLLRALRCCTVPEQERFAALAATKRNYLYQLAGGRSEPKVGLALRICKASITMHIETTGRVPKLRAEDLVIA